MAAPPTLKQRIREKEQEIERERAASSLARRSAVRRSRQLVNPKTLGYVAAAGFVMVLISGRPLSGAVRLLAGAAASAAMTFGRTWTVAQLDRVLRR